MIITTRFVFKGFDAFTVWPFIFVRPECKDDVALIEHELVHYREQRKTLTVPWLLRYWLSKKFRFHAELRAYCRQVELGGLTPDEAAVILTRYGVPVTRGDALAQLTALLEDQHEA